MTAAMCQHEEFMTNPQLRLASWRSALLGATALTCWAAIPAAAQTTVNQTTCIPGPGGCLTQSVAVDCSTANINGHIQIDNTSRALGSSATPQP